MEAQTFISTAQREPTVIIIDGVEYDADRILQRLEHEWPWIGREPGALLRALLEEREKSSNSITEPRAQSATDIQLHGCRQHGRRDCKTC